MPTDQSTTGFGLCECGCGERTRVSSVTVKAYGAVKGQPRRFVNGHTRRSSGPEYAVQSNGCWRWLRSIYRDGYGAASDKGRAIKAHILTYERVHGPVPDGFDLDHVCHNADKACPGGRACLHRRCVNPAHLEAVPPRTNILRGQTPAAMNAEKTACLNGHPFNEENTYIVEYAAGRTRRQCRACKRDRKRQARANDAAQYPLP